MPQVNVQLETPIDHTFRVDQVAGLFDVQLEDKARLDLSVHLPDPGDDWRVGVIAGPSGSGKSSVARAAYGKAFIERTTWPKDKAMVDGFAAGIEMSAISGALNAVGFSTPPAWVLPYTALSTGQRMRADLARALLRDEPVAAFDEFTSVVDRQVGRFASAAVAKAVRKRRVPLERFVAVTCHYDVIDWLEPDWVLDMADGRLTVASEGLSNAELARGWVQRRKEPWARPAIRIAIARGDKAAWGLFARHHYLSADMHPAARVYLATWEGRPVALAATLANAGHRGRRIVHRLVVLPDFQGMGIGLRLLDAVAAAVHDEGYAVSIRTSHPALIASLRRGGVAGQWRVHAVARSGSKQRGFSDARGSSMGAIGRSVATFRFSP